MKRLAWWLRITGLLYILNGIMMAFVRAPILTAGPAGALQQAAAGNPLARFLVDTWLGFGLEVLAIGVILWVISRSPRHATGLAWAVIAIEVARGLVYDGYMIAQGYATAVYVPWIVIHAAVITTGLLALRGADSVHPMPVSSEAQIR
jgi:hypothetical protein